MISEKVKKLVSEKQSIVIAVSEGIKTADGRYVCELSAPSDKTDSFGHVQLSGTGKYLSDLIIESWAANPELLNCLLCSAVPDI